MESEPLLHHDAESFEGYDTFISHDIDIIPYDFGGFDDFYTRHGFVRDNNLDMHRPPKEVKCLVISWLYFGLLSELLGRLVTARELDYTIFIRDNRRLRTILHTLSEKERDRSKQARGKFLENSYDLLVQASRWCERFETYGLKEVQELVPILLAVRTLISSLATLLFQMHEDWEDESSGVKSVASKPLEVFGKLVSLCLPLSSFYGSTQTHNIILAQQEIGDYRNEWPSFKLRYNSYARVINPSPAIGAEAAPTFTTEIFAIRMQKNNWCPHQIQQVLASHDYIVCEYLSNLARSNSRSHQACSNASRCVADNAPTGTQYTTKHTTQDCECDHLSSPMEAIADIITRGKLPLLSIAESEGGNLTLLVSERTASSRYIAISHVWADGFGNPSANSLPDCTLRQLKSWLANLPLPKYEVGLTWAGKRFDASRLDIMKRTPWFWMDTLCIPVEGRYAHLRSLHINDMASIYAGASQVLVLDAELLNISTLANITEGSTPDRCAATEVLARIAFCTWSRRSWTFQEGALGPENVFQLNDTAVDVVSQWTPKGPRHPLFTDPFAFPHPGDHLESHVFKTLYLKVWHMLQRTYGLEKHQKQDYNRPAFPNPARRFGNIELVSKSARRKELRHHGELLVRCWNELAIRSTTMPEDIHIIMANLLDFDTGRVMSLPRAQRMAVMMRSIQHLPFSLLFIRNIGAEDRDGFHCTWLPEEPSGKLMPDHYMELDDRGLSTPAHSPHFASILLPIGIGERCTLHHPQLRVILDLNVLLPIDDQQYDQSQYRLILVLPTSQLARLTWSDKSVYIKGACFVVLGYSDGSKEVKSTKQQECLQKLHISLRGHVEVKAIALANDNEALSDAQPSLQRSNTSVHRWPPTDAESVPDATSLLVVCDLSKHPKLERRTVSTSHLSSMLLHGYFGFYANTWLAIAIIYIIYTLISVDSNPHATSPRVWIAFGIFFIMLSTVLLACCVALAHQERCALLESFNYGRKPENSSEKWTGWVTWAVRFWYRFAPPFGRYAYGPWFWGTVYRWLVGRFRRNAGEVLAEESRWEWAEERGIERIHVEERVGDVDPSDDGGDA